MEEKKYGFFKRVKMAIFNLEDYKIFANEPISKAFGYFLKLIAIVTLVLAIFTTVRLRNQVDKLGVYIRNEFPEFSYEDGNLNIPEKTEAYDKEYNAKLVVDTSDNLTDEQIQEYRDLSKDGFYSLVLLKDKAYFGAGGYEYSLTYSDVLGNVGIKNIDKQGLVNDYLNDDMMFKLTVVIFIYSIIVLFFTNFLTLIEDVLIIAIFGWLASAISKAALSFSKSFILAIYAVTLSLILSAIYSIILSFTGFEIKYFSIMYMIISYIYIVAAILIIKSENNDSGVGQEIPIEEPKKEEEKIEENLEEKKETNEDREKKKEEKKDKSKEEGTGAEA